MATYLTTQGHVPQQPEFVGTYLSDPWGNQRLIVEENLPNFDRRKIATVDLPVKVTFGTLDRELAALGFKAGTWKRGHRQLRAALAKA